MDADKILPSLQALILELNNKGKLYEAFRVVEGMRLIRTQVEKIRLLPDKLIVVRDAECPTLPAH